MDRERFDAGGRECPEPGVLTWRARLWEAEAIGVPLAASVRGGASSRGGRWKVSHRAGVVPRPPERAGEGRVAGPGLWRTWQGRKRLTRVRAGTHARRMFRGLSGSRPGQPGRRALKRGGWISRLRDMQGAACRVPDSIRRIPGRARSAPPRCGTGYDPAPPIHNPQRHCPRAALRTDLSHTPAEMFARARLRLANACRDARAGYNSGNPPSSSSAPEPRIHSVISPSLHSLKHHGMDSRLKGEDDEWPRIRAQVSR